MIDAIRANHKVTACRLMKEHVLEALNVLLSLPELKAETTGKANFVPVSEDSPIV